MTGADQTREWSIGGWNCDKNQNSRDAIVILDANHEIVGTPWRGNLRLGRQSVRGKAGCSYAARG